MLYRESYTASKEYAVLLAYGGRSARYAAVDVVFWLGLLFYLRNSFIFLLPERSTNLSTKYPFPSIELLRETLKRSILTSIQLPSFLSPFPRIEQIQETKNERKPWKEQIKPFNFFLVGFHTIKENGKVVKPLAPFIENYQTIVYRSFIDYETGEIKQGSQYFKPLSETILQYVEHPENKFDGDIGVLERKYIQADDLIYIGKEANNIEDQPLEVTKPRIFINMEKIKQKILTLIPEEARKIGIKHRSELRYLKEKAREGKLNFNTPVMRKVQKYFSF
jgi:hypothetical protein